MSVKRVAIVLIILAILATAAFLAVTYLFEEPPKPLSNPNFRAVEVRAVDPLDRPESSLRANEESTKVIGMLNDYYLQAFLRPKRWVPDPKASPPPTPPDDALAAFFVSEADSEVRSDLRALALSGLARSLERVDPTKQELTKLSVEFEEDGSMPLLVATVTFEAIGSLNQEREKNGKPVALEISHTASLWLIAEGGGYKIFAYSVELKTGETVVSAAWGRPPEERFE